MTPDEDELIRWLTVAALVMCLAVLGMLAVMLFNSD